jgi:hypothetical protein
VPGLRLLLTARPGPAADRLRGPADFDLTDDRPADYDDIEEHLRSTTVLGRRERIQISEAACGNYLYADVAARFRLFDTGQQGCVDSLYEQLLADDPFARQVLALLGRTRDNGFPCREVAELVGAAPERVAEVLSRWRRLLWRGRLHHRCLAEYLSAAVALRPDEHDWLIARRLSRRWSGRWRSCRDVYSLRNLMPHLADVAFNTTDVSRRAWATESVARAVGDPDFLTTGLARVGVDDVLSAMSYAKSRLPTLHRLESVASVVCGEAINLRLARHRRDSSLIVQQLMYQASSLGDRELSRSMIDHIGRGVLTMWTTLDSWQGETRLAEPRHATQVTDAITTSAGTHAITASGDGTLRLWNLASGRVAAEAPTADFAGPGSPTVQRNVLEATKIECPNSITAVGFNACSSTWISGQADGDAVVWDLNTGESIRHLSCRGSEVTAVAVSADGRTAATGSLTGDIRVWDIQTGAVVLSFAQPGTVGALALTPKADRVIVGCDLGLTVHRIATCRQVGRVADLYTGYPVTAAAVNPVMPGYVLFGTANGQVAYVRLP